MNWNFVWLYQAERNDICLSFASASTVTQARLLCSQGKLFLGQCGVLSLHVITALVSLTCHLVPVVIGKLSGMRGGGRRRWEKRDSVNYKESATSQVLWIQFLMYRIRFQQQTGSGRIRNTHGQQTGSERIRYTHGQQSVPQIALAKSNLRTKFFCWH